MSEEKPAYQAELQEPASQPQQPPTDTLVQQPAAPAPAYSPGYVQAPPGYVAGHPGAYGPSLMGAAMAQQQALAANLPPAQVCSLTLRVTIPINSVNYET